MNTQNTVFDEIVKRYCRHPRGRGQ